MQFVKYNSIKNQCYDDLAVTLMNIHMIAGWDEKVIVELGDKSITKSVRDTLIFLIMGHNLVISKDHDGVHNIEIGEHTPDITLQSVPCTYEIRDSNKNFIYVEDESILGIEHFKIGCRFTNNKRINRTHDFIKYALENKYIDNNSLKDTSIDRETNIRGDLDRLLKSFEYSYKKHIKKIEDYIKNINERIGIKDKVSAKDIWFLIDNIDSTIVSIRDGEEQEIPFVLTNEALDIMNKYNNQYEHPRGIIYVGITKVYIITYEHIDYLIKHRDAVDTKLIKLNSTLIRTYQTRNIWLNKNINLYTVNFEESFVNIKQMLHANTPETIGYLAMFDKDIQKIVKVELTD